MNPSNLADEPVTSNCSLSSGALVITMGVQTLNTASDFGPVPSVAGHYGALPSSPGRYHRLGRRDRLDAHSHKRARPRRARRRETSNYWTDDTAAIQKAITAAQTVNGAMFFPTGTYGISSPLSVTSSALEFLGSGVHAVTTSLATIANLNAPTAPPWLTGTVIVQTSAATDIVDITGTGASVNVENIGARVADAYRFTNTGHGFYAEASHQAEQLPDVGLYYSYWRNVMVFGVDGNHDLLLPVERDPRQFPEHQRLRRWLHSRRLPRPVWDHGNQSWDMVYCDYFQSGTALDVSLAPHRLWT